MIQKCAFGVKVMFLFLIQIHLNGQDRTLLYENEYHIRPISEINALGIGDAYPWISKDGLRLYYTAQENHDSKSAIWTSSRQDVWSAFESHEKLSINNEKHDNLASWISNNELTIAYVQRKRKGKKLTQILIAQRNSPSANFNLPKEITLEGNIKGTILSPSLTQDLSELIVYNEYNSNRYLLHFEKVSDRIYALKGSINIPKKYTIKTGKLSGDGLSYYISLESKSQKPRIYVLTRNQLAESFNTLHPLKNNSINNTSERNHQPYFSDDGNFVVFTRSAENEWKHNEIFIGQLHSIGYNEVQVSLNKTHDDQLQDLAIYPNPSSDFVSVSNPKNRTIRAAVYDSNGQLVDVIENENLSHQVDISGYEAGSYIFRIQDIEQNTERVFRVIKVE